MLGRKSPCSLSSDNFLIKTHIVWSGQTVLSTGRGNEIDLKQSFLFSVFFVH